MCWEETEAGAWRAADWAEAEDRVKTSLPGLRKSLLSHFTDGEVEAS